MDSEDNLLAKIKKGLTKSGFPLELKTSKILKERSWNHSMCNYYLDFESNVYREYDIHADKRINGIDVTLFIECKKSENKQMILYTPQNKKFQPFMSIYFKAFPKLPKDIEFIKEEKKVNDAFIGLPLFDKKYKLSQSIIFSKGENIEQDNSTFFGSLNGLIKQSILSGYDGFIETSFRSIFLYLVVFDGLMFELSSSEKEDFSLNEIDYGQYSHEYHMRPQINFDNINQEFYQHMLKYGDKFMIEIMKPAFIPLYLDQIEHVISNLDKDKIKNWGLDWPEIKYKK